MNQPPDPLQARLRVLADASRFRILQLLLRGTQHVGEVATAVGLSQSCTTRHLQSLERADLVVRSPRGRQVEVALSADARALLAALAGDPALGGADPHADAPLATAGTRAPRSAVRASNVGTPPGSDRRRAGRTRASTPRSDTPPSTAPAAAPPVARPAPRSRLEEFLL